MSKELIVLCGPAGSGKSTWAKKFIESIPPHSSQGWLYINQDSQGKEGHKKQFEIGLKTNCSMIIDRMGFSKEQRSRYLIPAKEKGYKTKIIIFQTARHLCFTRMGERQDHPTINNLRSASSAMNTFMKGYERPTSDEADEIEFIKCNTSSIDQRDLIKSKPVCIVVDLDGTLCNIDHRLHYVEKKLTIDTVGQITKKPDWKSFFKEIPNDSVNDWCAEIINNFEYQGYCIVYASGRPDSYRKETEEWLTKNDLFSAGRLFMRERNDYRQDYLAKEAILDFCIEPSYDIKFILDDRKQVVDMWRRRGYVCLQVAEGDF